MAKYEHPGCDACACPRGVCASKNPDAAVFLIATRGIPAYKVAWALNSLQSGVTFNGCSKMDMAEVWGTRDRKNAYNLGGRTNSDLEAALKRACDGSPIAPTRRR